MRGNDKKDLIKSNSGSERQNKEYLNRNKLLKKREGHHNSIN